MQCASGLSASQKHVPQCFGESHRNVETSSLGSCKHDQYLQSRSPFDISHSWEFECARVNNSITPATPSTIQFTQMQHDTSGAFCFSSLCGTPHHFQHRKWAKMACLFHCKDKHRPASCPGERKQLQSKKPAPKSQFCSYEYHYKIIQGQLLQNL